MSVIPTVSADGVGAIAAGQLNAYTISCYNTGILRTVVGQTGMSVFLQGTNIPNDGGQGTFYWDYTSTATDNNSTVIRPYGVIYGAWIQAINLAPEIGNVSNTTALATGSTTARTLANRFADVTNVLDFGADPTGTTECSSAIQAAINYAASKGSSFPSSQGGLVFFPAGTYLIGATLTLTSGVVLSGEGVWNTELKSTSSFSNIMISAISTSAATTISQAGVENMSIFGNSQLTTGVQFQNNNRSFVRNCRFFGHNYGFAGADNWQVALLDVWMGEGAPSQQNNIGFYFFWDGTKTYNSYLNNAYICQNCNTQGALVCGLRAENAQGSIFTNCQAIGVTPRGWYFGEPPNVGGTYANLQFIFMDNCQSDTTSDYGIVFARGNAPNCTGIIMTNIWAGLETASLKANIYFKDMSDVVLDGFFTASSSYSVFMDGCDHIIIANGRCTNYDYYNTGAQCIYITNSTNCQVLGCSLTPYAGASSPGAGIYEAGTANKNLVADNVLPLGWSMGGANSIARDNMGASAPLADYGKYLSAASTTTQASINIPAGTAPTSPSNGDIWFDGTNLKIQIGGVTKTFTVV